MVAFGEKTIDAVPILMKWIGSDDKFSHVTAAGHILRIDPAKADELIPILVDVLVLAVKVDLTAMYLGHHINFGNRRQQQPGELRRISVDVT